MANPAQVNKPTPKGEQVTITLPPGVTKEAYEKSFSSYMEQKELGARKMKADWAAMVKTCKAHPDEWHRNRVEAYKAEGLDSSKLKVKK